MSGIFEHTDSSDDRMYLTERSDGWVKLISDADVRFDRDDITRMRDALTAWLGDGTPQPTPLTEDRVREIVREEWNASLTLMRPLPIVVDHASREAGHAEDIWGAPCNECTHSTGVHVSSGCTQPGCTCLRMSGECGQPSAPADILGSALAAGVFEQSDERCAGCSRGMHPHAFTRCPDCECRESAE